MYLCIIIVLGIIIAYTTIVATSTTYEYNKIII